MRRWLILSLLASAPAFAQGVVTSSAPDSVSVSVYRAPDRDSDTAMNLNLGTTEVSLTTSAKALVSTTTSGTATQVLSLVSETLTGTGSVTAERSDGL